LETYVLPASGQFRWSPTAAPATNRLSLIVTDSGSPSLSATQSFTVTVYPPPRLQALSLDATRLSLGWLALAGQVYQLEYKNDLNDPLWLPLDVPVSGAGTFLSLTNQLSSGAPRRFFRLRVLPLGTVVPLVLRSSLETDQLTLSWPTQPGQSYQLEYKPALEAANWSPLGVPLPGTGVPLVVRQDLSAAAQRLFRVKALP
jgi:hypothetical protein